MLKSSQKIKNFANSNDSVLENVGLKMTLNAGGEKKKKANWPPFSNQCLCVERA